MQSVPAFWHSPRIRWVILGLGICLWTLSFFLPSCDLRGTRAGNPLIGWQCAQLTLRMMGPVAKEALFHGWERLLLILSGWLNPLLATYLVLSFTQKHPTARIILIFSMGLSLTAAWIFLICVANLQLLIGHYLWVAGTILIALPEASRLFQINPPHRN